MKKRNLPRWGYKKGPIILVPPYTTVEFRWTGQSVVRDKRQPRSLESLSLKPATFYECHWRQPRGSQHQLVSRLTCQCLQVAGRQLKVVRATYDSSGVFAWRNTFEAAAWCSTVIFRRSEIIKTPRTIVGVSRR